MTKPARQAGGEPKVTVAEDPPAARSSEVAPHRPAARPRDAAATPRDTTADPWAQLHPARIWPD